ncbi:RimJ/RimL family protein N-acetyltransferase [Gillisia mitskevichiae]|uniref:RimJ/RimL family protein N-acetyltransferase n=1 Tax=Gillisia mitskevichiae TaxID=270921 RepID=A0A495PUR4_9FLAO|nr:GNAT family N-acetyltransferase [Gillisia mitskevichiae]RKS53505.1 RimJ/RimL family protein N-acetyltransferase [Gillisia mitskevichiae]
MNQDITYHTERLSLRLSTLEDAAFMLELLNTPKWLQFIGDRNIRSKEDAEAYIQNNILPVIKKYGFGNFTVIRKSDNSKIGCCGLYDREGVEGIDIGFAFLPEYENQGYALESAFKIKELALKEFRLDRLSAITNKKNIGSQKLLEKLDLEYKKEISLPNSKEPILLYKWEAN